MKFYIAAIYLGSSNAERRWLIAARDAAEARDIWDGITDTYHSRQWSATSPVEIADLGPIPDGKGPYSKGVFPNLMAPEAWRLSEAKAADRVVLQVARASMAPPADPVVFGG